MFPGVNAKQGILIFLGYIFSPIEQSGDWRVSSQVHWLGPVQVPWFEQLFTNLQFTVLKRKIDNWSVVKIVTMITNAFFRPMSLSEQLRTHPSLNPTLTLTW